MEAACAGRSKANISKKVACEFVRADRAKARRKKRKKRTRS